ncbi:hypothetical protein GCM10027521_42420 [Amycolatopsis cihanbeyliensis]
MVEQAILRAALDAFATRGFHGATMRQIAGLAEVTLANVYNYVDSKSDLLVTLLHRASDDQLADTRAAVQAAGGSVTERLRAAVGAYVRFDLERQAESRIVHSEYRYLDEGACLHVTRAQDQHRRLFADLVAEGVAAGVFHTPYPDQAGRAILAMCVGVPDCPAAGGPPTPEETERRYARYALALLEAR